MSVARRAGATGGRAVVAAARVLHRVPVTLLVLAVRAYQRTVSLLLGPVCRFHPSCSHYGMDALRAHGALRGTVLTTWRVLRCNPFTAGGVDDVPARRPGSRAALPLVLARGPGHVRPLPVPPAHRTIRPVAAAGLHDGRPVDPAPAV